MKNDNNESRNNQAGRSKDQLTLVDAARLSMGNGILPGPAPRLTRESLVSILQRTLELVEDEFDEFDEDLFSTHISSPRSNARRPFGEQ